MFLLKGAPDQHPPWLINLLLTSTNDTTSCLKYRNTPLDVLCLAREIKVAQHGKFHGQAIMSLICCRVLRRLYATLQQHTSFTTPPLFIYMEPNSGIIM